jgi:hypothetical protein
MKKIALCLMATCLSLSLYPLQSNAANPTPSALEASKSTESAKANALILRLDEIKAIDKSDLNSCEKKNLRIEVRSIKQQLSDIGGGVYISFGALIIIVLLLIILL